MSDFKSSLEPTNHLPTRPELCIRPPCLKRNNSAPPVDGPAALPFICSFSAPRSFSCNAAKRALSVRFNASAPEAYFTHSSVNYDRTPIECTRGGEQDLSMPPRGRWSEGEDDADESHSPIPRNRASLDEHHDHAEYEIDDEGDEMLEQFEPWVGIRERRSYSFTNANVSGGSPLSLDGDQQFAYRGLRSVGALCQRRAPLATSPEFNHAECDTEESNSTRSPHHVASMISPDATPMPSPSVARSIAASGAQNSSGIMRSNASSRDMSYFTIKTDTQPTSVDETTTAAGRPCSSHHNATTFEAPTSALPANNRLDALTHGDACDLSVEALLGSGLADCIADPIARLSPMSTAGVDTDMADACTTGTLSSDIEDSTAINQSGASPSLLREALAAFPATIVPSAIALTSSPMSSRSSSMDSFTRPTMSKLAGRADSLASSSGQSSPPTSWTESGAGSPNVSPSMIEQLASSLAQRVPTMSLELPPPTFRPSSVCSSAGSITPPTSGGSSPAEETPRRKKAVIVTSATLPASSSSMAAAPAATPAASCAKLGKNGKIKKTPEEMRAKREREKKREAERERRILGDDAGALGGF